MQRPDPPRLVTGFKDLADALKESHDRQEKTGKPHPVFSVGEEMTLKGGRFRVYMIMKDRLILKPIKY